MRKTAAGVFQFVELTNMDEACGRDNKGQPRYVVALALVDLSQIDAETKASARRSCGYDMPESEETPEMLAEMCYHYGTLAPLGSWEGNNAGKLLRAAKSAAHDFLDESALADQMEKPVNKIGSTAAEFMRGDIHSAISRGVQADDPAALLMAKLQGAPVTIMRQSDIRRCKFAILVPSHYRPDGTCRCDNAAHRAMMVAKWKYSPEDFEDIPLKD